MPALAYLVDYNYPTSADWNTPVTINVTVRNDGDEREYCMARLFDRDSGATITGYGDILDPTGQWSRNLPAMPSMPDRDWNLLLRYGHTEYGEEYWDGEVTFTITLSTIPPPDYPNCVITTLSYPSVAAENERVIVDIGVTENAGYSGTGFYELIDLDTGETVIVTPGSYDPAYQTFTAWSNERIGAIIWITMPPRNLRLRVDTGHLEDSTEVIDDSRTFTINLSGNGGNGGITPDTKKIVLGLLGGVAIGGVIYVIINLGKK
jgi:hypothetical protein